MKAPAGRTPGPRHRTRPAPACVPPRSRRRRPGTVRRALGCRRRRRHAV